MGLKRQAELPKHVQVPDLIQSALFMRGHKEEVEKLGQGM